MKLLIALLAIFVSAPALAQFSSPWGDAPFWERPSARSNAAPRESVPRGPSIASGGARPEITPKAPASIVFPYSYPANSVIIDTSERKLYYVMGDQQAYEYPISVGRDGFSWTGTESISRIQTWPDWYPPSEMRARDRRLPEKMTGGVRNPLGAVALYLGNSLYRIHGTNDEETIGEAASSGCFRMMNSAALHLVSLVQVGASVHVLDHLPPPVVAQQPLFPDSDRSSLAGPAPWSAQSRAAISAP